MEEASHSLGNTWASIHVLNDMVRHHLVPQMYLRGFADEHGMLAMVTREDLTDSRHITVNNACNETGFYSIPSEDLEPFAREGHDPEVVEKHLAQIESRAGPALEELRATAEVPQTGNERRYHLAAFAAIQMTRTWRFRRDMLELYHAGATALVKANTTDERLGAFLASKGRPTRPADIVEFRASLFGSDGPKLVVPGSRGVQAAIHLAVEEGIPELLSRSWHLRVFDEPVLLTSDAPIAMRSVSSPGDLAPALKTADAIYWPLDRHHVLSFERSVGKPKDKLTRDAPIGRAAKINASVAAEAERWIFHHPEDRPAGLEDIGALPPHPELVFDTVELPGDRRVMRARHLIRGRE